MTDTEIEIADIDFDTVDSIDDIDGIDPENLTIEDRVRLHVKLREDAYVKMGTVDSPPDDETDTNPDTA